MNVRKLSVNKACIFLAVLLLAAMVTVSVALYALTQDISKPVYGYLMDEDENFIIDEEAAPVVKQIYNLCLAGNGPTKIARMLTEQQIPTPGTLEYRRTGSTRRYHPGYECKWATNTVVHILENREYTGCLVNFKTEKLSYKVKHSVENPLEKQVIFENHHEPIIDTQTWERVQELRKQRKRPNRYDEVGLFSGILFCADCGSVMYQQRYQTDNDGAFPVRHSVYLRFFIRVWDIPASDF